jgi:outer membrane protein W
MPFALLGFGVHRSTLRFDATPTPPREWYSSATTEERVLIDDRHKSNVAFAFGSGFDVPLKNDLFVGVEARYFFLKKVTYEGRLDGLRAVDVSERSLQVSARLGWKFRTGLLGDLSLLLAHAFAVLDKAH